MQAIEDIFAIWPSLPTMANELGENYDTVLKWKNRGRIPETAWPKVIEKAALREKLVTASQLMTLNAPIRKMGWPKGKKRA